APPGLGEGSCEFLILDRYSNSVGRRTARPLRALLGRRVLDRLAHELAVIAFRDTDVRARERARVALLLGRVQSLTIQLALIYTGHARRVALVNASGVIAPGVDRDHGAQGAE